MALFAQGLASCGSDDSDGDACEPNALRACAGPGMCAGTQTCASDGSAYSECSCGSGSAGAAGSGGSGGGSNGGAAGAGGDGQIDPLFDGGDRAIGSPCTSDAECPQGPNGESPLVCILPTSSAEFGTGSPQGGYCTAPCSTTPECQALDGLSACNTALGQCIALCQPGDGDNLVKCNPDRAQACFQLQQGSTIGACFPVCQNDAACGPGLFCDLGASGLGLCVTTAPVGGEIGAACTGATAATDCKSGTCVTLIDGTSFCSANCTFGLVEGCGFARTEAAGARDAVCLFTQLNDGGPGDAGFCAELCDVDADCEQAAAGWTCAEDLGADLVTLLGRAGECVPPGFGGGADAGVVDAGN